jgi:hypothetical protein
MDEKIKRLHLGCGPKKLDGWINIDSVKEFHPDIVHDISRPLPFADLSVDEVLAEGLLEHFDKYARYAVVYEWTRVLKIGGTITMQLPDFQKLLFRYFKFGFDKFVDLIFGENMYRSEVYIGHFGNHKFGYSPASLQKFMQLFGIEPVIVKTKSLNINFAGKKTRHVSREEIDQIEIFAYANVYGEGKPRLPFKFVREKIKYFQELNETTKSL